MGTLEKWGNVGRSRLKCLYCGKTTERVRQKQQYCDNEECEYYATINKSRRKSDGQQNTGEKPKGRKL